MQNRANTYSRYIKKPNKTNRRKYLKRRLDLLNWNKISWNALNNLWAVLARADKVEQCWTDQSIENLSKKQCQELLCLWKLISNKTQGNYQLKSHWCQKVEIHTSSKCMLVCSHSPWKEMQLTNKISRRKRSYKPEMWLE